MSQSPSRRQESALRHIARFQALIGRWNVEADGFRRIARGDLPVSSQMLDEVDEARHMVREALHDCDRISDRLEPGDQRRSDLMQIATALEALSESLAISAEHLALRVEADDDVAALPLLPGKPHQDAQLEH